jgi:hypothetical protein
LDEATDHDEPKSAVIELLMISHQRAESRASSVEGAGETNTQYHTIPSQ